MIEERKQLVRTGITACLPQQLSIGEDQILTLKQAITDCRECHEGSPKEARILFVSEAMTDSRPLVVKVKIQLPETAVLSGPSSTTEKELQALQTFKDADLQLAPNLVAFEKQIQDERGPLPGGYITYTFMTKMPGQNLLDYKYWSATFEERKEIQDKFIIALKSLWSLGIAPTDRALRNVLWEASTKQLSIVDFESWETPSGLAMTEEHELQRWGLAQRPPPGTWIDEWKLHHRTG